MCWMLDDRPREGQIEMSWRLAETNTEVETLILILSGI